MNWAKRQRAARRHMETMRTVDERDVGISEAAAAALAPLMAADIDDPSPPVVRHYVVEPARAFDPTRTACGIDGVRPNTNVGTSSESGVTCEACRAEIAVRHAREDKRALDRVRKNPVHVQKIESDVRARLEAAGLVVRVGGWMHPTEAGKAKANPGVRARRAITDGASYKNPWHVPGKPEYGPATYETDATPTEHAGCLIFERVAGKVWDVVRDGVCVTQRAGANGAREAAEMLSSDKKGAA